MYRQMVTNEQGEPLGIDYIYDDAPDPDDFYDRDYDERPTKDPAECEHPDRDMEDRRKGNAALEEMPTEDALYWRCLDCDAELPITAEDLEFYYNH